MSALTRALEPIVGAEHVDDLIEALRMPGGELRALMAVELFGAPNRGDDGSDRPIVASVEASIADAVERRKAALSSATTILTVSRAGTQGFGNPALDEVSLMALAGRIDLWLAGERTHPSVPKTVLAIQGQEQVALRTRDDAIDTVLHVLDRSGASDLNPRRARHIVDALSDVPPDGTSTPTGG